MKAEYKYFLINKNDKSTQQNAQKNTKTQS